MSQIYLEYNFIVTPIQPGSEILIAELAYAGFESFVETNKGVKAYINKKNCDASILENIYVLSSKEFSITFSIKEIEQVNWNAEWEKNFSPIVVDNTCIVRAPFHSEKNVAFEIIIEPKMSFGTGHHETTFMMLQFILENNFKNKKVLDMGCGTAVLAILTELKEASTIDAIDIDAWCYANSKENIERNHCKNISVYLGDSSLLSSREYDIIIANINRNILLDDIGEYRKCLQKGGELYLSGFYTEDLPLIIKVCNKHELTFVSNKKKNNWIAAKFVH